MSFTSFRRFHGTRLGASLSVLALFMASQAAFAHSHPVTMTPAANATVAPPANVIIHFSEELEPKFSKVTVADAAGHPVNKGPSVVGADAKTMTVPLPDLKPGVYTVNWVTVATDSHRLTGKYKFTVK